MSDAILTFQVQLSAVMETVLKSAMYEITRLVEDSFLEEVARSKQEVEALRQRLQWWESRRRERESGGRARCVDCGRAGVSSQETEDPPSGTPSGVEEGRGLKQEKVPEGSWSSCSGGGVNPGAQNALEEEATPSSLRDLDLSSTAPTDSDGERPDSLLKEEGEEPQEMSGGDDVQGKWLLCPEGETLPGAEGAPPLPLSKGCGEPEWSPAVRQDTAPSSDSLLAEQSSRAAAGESCGSYESQGQEGSARSLSLAGPQRCGRHWQRPAWTPFKLGDSDSEPDGLDPSYAAEPEPASPPAQREPQPRPAEEGAGHSASPLQYLNVKWEGGVADAPLVKEEAEMQPVCSEEMRWDAAHREPWDRGDLQMQVHQLSATNARAKRRKSKDGQREFSNVARQVLTQFQVWQKACYSKNIDWNPVIAKIISALPQLLGRETEVVDRCTKMLQNRREYLRRTGQVTRQNISGSPPPKSGPNHMLSSRMGSQCRTTKKTWTPLQNTGVLGRKRLLPWRQSAGSSKRRNSSRLKCAFLSSVDVVLSRNESFLLQQWRVSAHVRERADACWKGWSLSSW